MDQGGLGSSAWHLHRWDLHLDTGVVHERELSHLQCEFCVIDNRRTGRYTRYIYAARFADQKERMTSATVSFNGLLKIDLETGSVFEHILEDDILGGEAMFAPCGDDKEDGAGVLMTFGFNPNTSSSELYVVDCKHMKCATRVALPQRVPFGFHGTWLPACAV